MSHKKSKKKLSEKSNPQKKKTLYWLSCNTYYVKPKSTH